MKPKSTPAPPDSSAFKQAVDQELGRLFAAAITNARSIDTVYAELLEVTRDTLLAGGKRLRPYLAYLAYTGLGGKDHKAFITIAAGQELLHHFLLIHDDIMDRDLIRHGGPNVEGAYFERFKQQGYAPADALHHAESFALMAGNAAWALGMQTISDVPFDAHAKLAAQHCVQRMLFEIMGGQLMDIDSAISGRPATTERLLSICRYKTATYSFQTPLQLGAILAAAEPAIQEQLRQFGLSLGIAFQVADDLLGVYGDEAKLGKPVTSDLREGKQTLLIYHAYELATPAQAKTLRRLWGSSQSGPAELATVKDILTACGAQAKTTSLAASHLDDSLRTLAKIPLIASSKAEIERIAHYCMNRQN
jgi:geranylgeranyl diphosphate synthase, type II